MVTIKDDKWVVVFEKHTRKYGVDYSDQIISYATMMRKGIKWYRKFSIHFLLAVSVVNAMVLHKIVTKKTVNRKFRELTATELLGLSENTTEASGR